MLLRPFLARIFSSTFSRFYSSESKNLNHRDEYEHAFQSFDRLIHQKNVNIKSLLAIIDTCARSGQIDRARQIEKFINQSNKWKNHIRLQTSLIHMYMKCHLINEAERIFQRTSHLPDCDVIVYNTMLKGYLQNRKAERCLEFWDRLRSKISPDNVTYLLLFNACSILRDAKRGLALHQELSSTLDIQHVHLQNALIEFYGRINRIEIAEKLFDDMILHETSTFNTLMKAYLVNQMPLKVLELFEQMKEDNIKTIGPTGFQPDLITFMAVCDACNKLGLLKSPESSYGEFNWKRIFSQRIKL